MNSPHDDEYRPNLSSSSSSSSLSPVRHHACVGSVAHPHNIASTLALFSASSSRSSSPLFSHFRASFFIFCMLIICQLLSVSCSSETSHAGVNLMSDEANSWPINVDSLFAPLDEIQQQEQSAPSSSHHSSLVSKSNLNFDVFDPSLTSASDDSLFSGAPDFNVMSTTSVAGGALVSWDSSSTTSYSVTQGQNVSITSQLKVTDLTGAVIQLASIGTTSITISVPSSYGTLSIPTSASSGLTFTTAQSKVSTLTFTGNFVLVEVALASLVFSASSNATVGDVNITYSPSFAALTTSFSLAIKISIVAIPTPTTIAPTTPAPPTTSVPTIAPGALRLTFPLGNVTSITVTASHPYLLQQHRAMLQAVLAHFTAQATTITLRINTTAFNARLQADICSACNISAAFCNTTNPTPENSRVIVISTEYVSASQSTLATVDFNPVTSTSSSSSAAGPASALALAEVFSSSTSLSSYSTLAQASVTAISITCLLNGNSYPLSSYQSDCTSSSGVQWYVPVIVVVVVIGVLGIVVGVVLFARNWKKRQQLEQKSQALVGEDEASPVAVAPSNVTATNKNAAADTTAAASSPSPAATTPTTTATAGVNSGVVTTTGLVPAATTTAAPTAAPAAAATPSSPPVTSGAEIEMMPTNGEYPGVQPGLKFMYSAPDWEPEADEQGDGVGAMASEIHLDLDAPTGSTMPRLGATLDDNNSARFSYVPRDS